MPPSSGRATKWENLLIWATQDWRVSISGRGKSGKSCLGNAVDILATHVGQ